jgi:hypothetical protein
MTKAILRIGYTDYVMDMADAVVVMEAFNRAESYKVVHDYKASPSTTAYHIWAQDVGSSDSLTIQLLPDAVYRVAKLAGKPKE